MSDFSNFLEVQTKTAWGRTLAEFASFCHSSINTNLSPELARPGRSKDTFVYMDGRAGVEGPRSQHTPVVLDIGCGPGLLPAMFARQGYTAFGIDTDFFLLSSFLSLNLTQADALHLPFQASTFDCVTATNVLFLLDDPLMALREWRRVLLQGGAVCLLNPSEHLSLVAARELADQRGLDGVARESLLDWAHNAETHFRWTEYETQELLSRAGFRLQESILKIGPGFARFACAR